MRNSRNNKQTKDINRIKISLSSPEDMLEKSSGFAVEHYKAGMPYPDISLEKRKFLLQQIVSCSDYLFYENWENNFKSYHNGHPLKATIEMLGTLTGAELSTNGCQTGENYKINSPDIDYNMLFNIVASISEYDSSILVKWGQRLLFNNYIFVDGKFGPNTCEALNNALNRPVNTACGDTFQKDEILNLIALKKK